MIISCPHCQTKYQVTYEAIGSAGRKVQCAHCQQAWDQGPIDRDDPPPEVRKAQEAITEDQLDEAMSAQDKAANAKSVEEKAAKLAKAEKDRLAKAAKGKKAGVLDQASAGKIDPSVIRKRRRAFSHRQEKFMAEGPMAQVRLALRITGGVALVTVLALAYLGRMQVVQRFPAMAGVYEAVGLGVNVVGLEFSGLSAMQTLRNGKEVLIVSAQIVGLARSPVPVPAVVVTLVGPGGQGVYQWSVQPNVSDLMAGERATFDTQLTLPPGNASRLRLSFADGTGVRAGNAQPTPAEAIPAAAAPAADDHADDGADAHAHEAETHAPAAAEHPAAATSDHGGAAAPETAIPEHH